MKKNLGDVGLFEENRAVALLTPRVFPYGHP